MTFKEITERIKTFGDAQIDCSEFVVRSSFEWLKLNESFLSDSIKRGVNPRDCQNCLQRKRNAQLILETLEQDQEKIKAPYSPLKRFASIYPLK